MAQSATQQGNPTYGGVPVLVSPVTGGGSGVQLSTPGILGVPSVDTESQKPTYSYTTASMALVAAPADILAFTGAANKVNRLKRARISITSTVSGALNLSLVRRSTASTGGTSASGTLSGYDTSDTTTPSMSCKSWTSNPTATGTTVATLMTFIQPVSVSATTPSLTPTVINFSEANLKAICLRGTSDILVLNGNLSTLTNADNKITCTLEWTEESSLQ